MRRSGALCEASSAAASSCENSSAEAGRSCVSFDSARITTFSTASGMSASGAARDGATGSVLMCRAITMIASSSVNGGLPVSMWYRMTPSEYRSLRASSCLPCACSGDM